MKSFVIIPTYNEKENIVRLAEEVLKQHPSINILFVDDNSPDGTGTIADELASSEERIRVLHRPGKLGLGSAYREGFRMALDLGADYIIEMDADFSHDPKILPVFLQAAASCDLVIGSRYLNGVSVVNWPLRRLMLSYFASVYARFVTGLKLMDCTSGFKCFRRETLESIDMERVKSDGYSFQIEMNYRCMEKGLRMIEVPIIFIDRHAGTSKISRKIVREAVVMVWKLRLGTVLRRIFGRKG
ncbi:polyprenol monophosphomannose synthase [Geobacter sp. SVR]|uniref:polyprenol monophosphomannose synthase n=1 Tax=Geobacter sp. SVR TaxID=2495594 RepID=UPI00143F0288|nr:polyprenol monophosphomannose synthase [Geobacter sp. SVR]BCS53660.1 dolichyl-phosphate beta-D-mannosyltransferase [Geobacter sp. SVR]GCF84143.1 dolichyl-phosphate beta-D-mannosyltransferase [Geobacter sp. SVR]